MIPEPFPVSFRTGSEDARLFTELYNQGIDSHLEAFTQSTHEFTDARLIINFADDELPLIIRRLIEHETEEADRWASDIILVRYGVEVDL